MLKAQVALPPPPPEPVEEVAPLTIEEAPFDAPGEESLTLIIEGVLSELALRRRLPKQRVACRRKARAPLMVKKMLRMNIWPSRVKSLVFHLNK